MYDEIITTPYGARSGVTKEVDGSYTHVNLTPGEGACRWCKKPLDADADMPSETCTKCWDEMFGDED